jgi:hypothetical protein
MCRKFAGVTAFCWHLPDARAVEVTGCRNRFTRRETINRDSQSRHIGVIARRASAEAIQTVAAEKFWIASLRSQ